jgi:hypothetical protein
MRRLLHIKAGGRWQVFDDLRPQPGVVVDVVKVRVERLFARTGG